MSLQDFPHDSRTPGPALAEHHDVLLLDLDGVVYVGANAVPHAVDCLNEVQQELGLRNAYVTNNASRTPHSIAEQLRAFGLRLADEDIVTSAQAGVRVLGETIPGGSRVLVVGGPGLWDEVERGGFTAVESASDEPAAVIQGFFPDVTWRRLAEATFALRAGAFFVATNTDPTIPVEGGIAPGNGLLVGVVTDASGVAPVVAGKPEPPLMLESVERTAAVRPLVVGDRLETDILGAGRSGLPSLLVLTGISGVAEVLRAAGQSRPTHLGTDLRALLVPPVNATVTFVEGIATASRCRDARAEIEDGQLVLKSPSQTTADGTAGTPGSASRSWLDQLRAAAALAWAARDGGREITIDAAIDQLIGTRPTTD